MNLKTYSKILIVTLCLVLFTIPALFTATPSISTANETPVKTTHVSQSGHKVLFDEAHCALGSSTFTPGNASLFSWILEEHGYDTDMNFDQQLDSGILTGVDILVLVFPMVALTAGEVTAVTNFVQTGGGLLLVGTDQNPTWSYSSINLNPLSQTFGVTFSTSTDDSWIATITEMITHHVTQDVSSTHSNVDYKLRGTTLILESPATSVVDYEGDSVAAVSEYGSGKVVCVGALAPFLQYRRSTHWQVEKDDLFQFGLNIADWLVDLAPRKVNVTERAVITIGSGPSLTPTEVNDYNVYTGIIHDHTTHSDGADSPNDMLWAGVSRGLDYIVMTDHSYEAENPIGLGGITGALAMKSIAELYDIDIEIFAGAELSRGHHSMAFPLTSNIYTDTQIGMVTGAHAQGAIIGLCHPTTAPGYLETYELFDTYGYDSIEVTCDGFSHGLWEEGYTKNFYGASDGHSFEDVGHILNIVFEDNPSGPDGRLADVDIVDAIMNKRIVILDKVSNILYGQQVWVDRYLELMGQAETDVANAEAIVESADEVGNTLASRYLEAARTALAYGCSRKAIFAASNATASEALDIAIDTFAPDPKFLYRETTHDLKVNISSLNSDAIEFNMTLYKLRALTIGSTTDIVIAPANGHTNWTTSITTPLEGYSALIFNLHDFNTTANLAPVIYGVGTLVNAGRHIEIEVTVDGTYVTGVFAIARADIRYLTHAIGFYDDGSGEQNGSAAIKTNTIEGTIGPYPKDTVITLSMTVYDIFGGVFVFPESEYTVTTGPLEPTTTTSGPPPPIDPVLLMAAAGGVIAVIVVVVVLMKRKK